MSDKPIPQITSELRAQWWEDWDKNISTPAYKGNGIFLDHESWGEHFTRKANEFIAAAVADAKRQERERIIARLNKCASDLKDWPSAAMGYEDAAMTIATEIIQQEPTQ